MAELPAPALTFPGGCPDCGERAVELPGPLPVVGDDFDWRVRDYDGFRLSMLEELAAHFPERSRWTPADLEVVLVEALSAVLDQLSDQLDRVAAEGFLDTARQPESLRRLLLLIGYDALALAGEPDTPEGRRRLAAHWLANPHAMEAARSEGPRRIHEPRRMVTVEDYAQRLEDHPLVLRAHAWTEWTGSWTTIRVAIIGWDNRLLDGNPVPGSDPPRRLVEPYPPAMERAIFKFCQERELPWPDPDKPPPEPPPPPSPPPSIRTVLTGYLDAYRMAGQEVLLLDAEPVGVTLALSVRVARNYYQSEVKQAVAGALSTGPEGFFRPGRLLFGEDLQASDVIAAVMALAGVESVCLNRFRRLGSDFADQVASGVVRLSGLEVAVCDNDRVRPERGFWRLTLHGGQKG